MNCETFVHVQSLHLDTENRCKNAEVSIQQIIFVYSC